MTFDKHDSLSNGSTLNNYDAAYQKHVVKPEEEKIADTQKRRNIIREVEEMIHECLTWHDDIADDSQKACRDLKRDILERLEGMR
jgi:hypothetical protein